MCFSKINFQTEIQLNINNNIINEVEQFNSLEIIFITSFMVSMIISEKLYV